MTYANSSNKIIVEESNEDKILTVDDDPLSTEIFTHRSSIAKKYALPNQDFRDLNPVWFYCLLLLLWMCECLEWAAITPRLETLKAEQILAHN